jgi:hypothetical protein
MKIVGDHLADVARKSKASDKIGFDLFGRSAYNRYYYAVFLHVRMVLRTMDSKWAAPRHKDVPTIFRGKVVKRVEEQIEKLEKSNLIEPDQAKRMFSLAATAADELSMLLDSAREVRKVADYEPEIPVTREGPVIKLGDCKLDTARNWKQRAETQGKTILYVYGQLGLITS